MTPPSEAAREIATKWMERTWAVAEQGLMDDMSVCKRDLAEMIDQHVAPLVEYVDHLTEEARRLRIAHNDFSGTFAPHQAKDPLGPSPDKPWRKESE